MVPCLDQYVLTQYDCQDCSSTPPIKEDIFLMSHVSVYLSAYLLLSSIWRESFTEKQSPIQLYDLTVEDTKKIDVSNMT